MGKLKLHKGYHIHKLLKRLLNFTLCFVHKPNITPVGSLPSSFKKHAHYYYITEVFNSQSAMAVHIQSAW